MLLQAGIARAGVRSNLMLSGILPPTRRLLRRRSASLRNDTTTLRQMPWKACFDTTHQSSQWTMTAWLLFLALPGHAVQIHAASQFFIDQDSGKGFAFVWHDSNVVVVALSG